MSVIVTRLGAQAGRLTLDVPETQVLIEVDGHATCSYEHHVLLARVRDTTFITLDSELVMAVEDLSREVIVPLPRLAPFPRKNRPYLALPVVAHAGSLRLRGRPGPMMQASFPHQCCP